MNATATFLDQYVRWLDVPMNEAKLVGRVKGVGDLIHDTRCARSVEPSIRGEDRGEIAASDVSHRDEQCAINFADPKHRDDVRMLDGGCDLRLMDKPLAEVWIRR